MDLSDGRTDHQQQPASQVHLPRRLKACVYCREQKLRCKRNSEGSEESCERCISARRQCIVPEPVRRRRPKAPRKDVSSVASLESKLDALVAALEERRGVNHKRQPSDIEPQIQAATDQPLKSIHMSDKTTRNPPGASNSDQGAGRRTLIAEHQYSYSFFLPEIPKAEDIIKNDVISQGILSLEEAEQVFTRFIKFMLPCFPVIDFPPGTTVSTLRGTKPALLLAILGAASNIMGESVQRELMAEVMKTYADRIILKGDKSLDLVQALQVTVLWYFPPEHFNEVKIYQFIHMAAIMTIDLGFAQPTRPINSTLPMVNSVGKDQLLPERPLLETSKRDEQRALLTCYVICSIASMMTRRPTIIRWNHYMGDCVKTLESFAEASTNDLFICQWAKAQHIVEEIGQHFLMDDPSANLDVSDITVRYVLRSLEQQFDLFKANIPPQVQAFLVSLQTEVNVINLYLHEIFLHVSHSNNGFRFPFSNQNISESRADPRLQISDPIGRKALAICIVSVKNALNNFLSLDLETLCVIPMFAYARTAYVVFAMMKIYFVLNIRDGDQEIMMDDDGLDVEFYLDALLNSMDRLAHMKKSRVGAIFRLILLMLRMWFRKQQRAKTTSDAPELGMHRSDSVLQTVLVTAEGMGADAQRGNAQNLSMEERATGINNTATFNRGNPELSSQENLPFGAERWTSNLEEEVPYWDEIDFASFLETEDSTLLQTALERLGGLMG